MEVALVLIRKEISMISRVLVDDNLIAFDEINGGRTVRLVPPTGTNVDVLVGPEP